VLFLDEPTTGFDPEARRSAWETVMSLCRTGKTVLLTTHYMDEAQELADRVAVIAAGQIVAEGPPDSIGGRDRAAARISFNLPADVSVADLPVKGAVHGRRVSLESTETTRVLHSLTSWAVERGIELERLEISRPTLEDVYLEVTRS
jgi:ABC-2 type transport system ATP-binding protein